MVASDKVGGEVVQVEAESATGEPNNSMPNNTSVKCKIWNSVANRLLMFGYRSREGATSAGGCHGRPA